MQDSMKDRVVLITGASSGIGLVATRELLRRGAQVFAACRSRERAERAFPGIRSDPRDALCFVPLELSDFESIRRCAATFLATGRPLHVLINNAGLAGARGLTRQGFEMTFGVNHLGHFLLTQLLLERLLASPPARVVNVASRAHRRVSGIPLDALRRSTPSWSGAREYNVSKLANVLFSAELGRRLAGRGVSTYALHPGVVDTAFWRAVPRLLRPLLHLRGMISPEAGARTLLHCATAPELEHESGLYYADCKVTAPTEVAQNRELASLLWQRSSAWVGPALSPERLEQAWDRAGA